MSKKQYWVKLAEPTKFHVKDEDGNIVIPKGTKGVEVWFHGSSKTWTRNTDGVVVHQNVYRWRGKTFNE